MTWLIKFIRSLFCRHKSITFIRNIYGDEINHAGGKRSVWMCDGCKWPIYKNTLHRNPNGEYAQ